MAPAAPKRDELFEAIVAACELELSSLTKSSRGEVNAARKQLTEVDATAGQVRVRAAKYRQRYPNSTLTPSALAKHWAGLSAASLTRDEDPGGWAR